ncbi:hypothetical protein NPIL_403911 [Nephila pilipes]|uniref:Secreted protein n=1 Tax=Nephila pilipes TaxID=299642 RepID=A0A8X6ID58_NEPPI|nr:hypothetical protein NPIL_403911 [Nephila pilipes]
MTRNRKISAIAFHNLYCLFFFAISHARALMDSTKLTPSERSFFFVRPHSGKANHQRHATSAGRCQVTIKASRLGRQKSD